MTDREAYIILNMLSGIGPARIAALSEFCGSPAAIFEASAEDLARIRGIGETAANAILHWQDHVDLERELDIAEKGGAEILTLADEGYPAILKEIHDAPVCLYLRGTLPPDLDARSVAMVGTRNVSQYGAAMARHLAESAAFAGWTTVSGLACGVDTIVHKATLDAGGKTVAVLGGGLARLHPRENLGLARDIVRTGGAVITEFPMSFSPTRHSFPMRNRIISGLSLGTLVIEAGLNSGSLITAAHALEQGKRIFAVPGQANNANANGCNALIRKGAVLTETFEHVMEEFDFLPGFEHSPSGFREESLSADYDTARTGEEADEVLSDADRAILDILRKGDASVDTICSSAELDGSTVLSALIALEILHRVRKSPDGTFHRLR